MIKIFFTASLLMLSSVSLAYECRTTIEATTPTENFLINPEGSVTDLRFGLVWHICTYGQVWDQASSTCKGDPKKIDSWSEAILSQDEMNSNKAMGHSDWRLPSIRELSTIVERKCRQPAINTEIFKGTATGVYWSNTPDGIVNPQLPGRIIDFSDGLEVYRAVSPEKYVRHVRSIN